MEDDRKIESVIVSYDHIPGKDIAVLLVGIKQPNQTVDIINALQGSEATDLWNKLITIKENV